MKRLIKALGYSLAGLKSAWQDEPAFRQEVVMAIFLLPLAFALAPDALSLVAMLASVFLVLIIELLNTAVEATVNRCGTDIHPLAKKAKDTASAAVLVALVNMAVVWGVILLRHP